VDEEATIALRAKARQDRIARGKPYREFVKEFVKPEPPKELLYYGSWGQDDDEELIATHWGGLQPERVKGKLSELPLIMVPDRRVLKISQLEQRVLELEKKYGEEVSHKS
jgi:hypothetical protein